MVLHTGARAVLYRGERRRDGAMVPVVVKELRALYPPDAEVRALRREYALQTRAAAATDAVVRPLGLESQEGVVRLVMEDDGGAALAAVFAEGPPPVEEGLRIALATARALAEVHRAGLVHKDVTPRNVVVGEGGVRLIDFGIASIVAREDAAVDDGAHFVGTPAFMAPEQTGRTGRSVDPRSDLYALGGVLYWLLCGRPPFEARDRLELVHAHLARTPTAPSAVRAEVPSIVSAIVMRLLAKAPEDRYQSADGVARDLERALGDPSSTFELGARDLGTTLAIPEVLYGREPDRVRLAAAWASAAAGGRSLALVSGSSGSGKTALVRQVVNEAALSGALIAPSKADQLAQGVPYATLHGALAALVERTLAADHERLSDWRARIQDAVGENAGVLAQLLPEARPLLGETRPPETVPPLEAENRLRVTVERFISTLAAPDHPLLIFLDDLQWADRPSLELVAGLARDTALSHLLILGAYRSESVGPDHPLTRTLSGLEAVGVEATRVELGPLGRPDVRALVSATVRRSGDDVDALADLLLERTGGNPFFLQRRLVGLSEDGLLRIDTVGVRWSWDLDAVRASRVGDDVVEYLAGRLADLPSASRELLAIAALIGPEFGLDLLARGSGRPVQDVQQDLQPAIDHGLVSPKGAGYWVAEGTAGLGEFVLRFAHDRVQEAAAEAVEPERRLHYHHALGLAMLRVGGDATAERPFEVVRHLDAARSELASAARQRLQVLAAEAGRQALASAAYGAAFGYLRTAIDLLDETNPGAWERDHAESLDLYVVAAQAAYLAGDRPAMEALVETACARSKTPLDTARAREVRIHALVAQNAQNEGVDAALEILKTLDVELPTDPTAADVETEVGATMGALSETTPEAIAGLPEMTNAQAEMGQRIMAGVSSAAYLARPNLLPLFATRIVRSSLEHGVSKQTPYGLIIFSLVLAHARLVEPAYLYGQLAVRLLDRWPDRALRVRIHHIFNTHVRPFREPVGDCAEALTAVFRLGVDCGDLEYASWAGHNHCCFLLYAGAPLDAVDDAFDRYGAALRKYEQAGQLACHAPWAQAVANLRGLVSDPAILRGPDYDEDAASAALEAIGHRGALFLQTTAQVMVRTLFGRPDAAVEAAERGEAWQDGAGASLHIPTFYFYDALARIDLAADADGDARAALLDRARTSRAHVEQLAAFCPANQAHRVALIDAGLCALEDGVSAALPAFERAVALALDGGQPHEAGVIYERAGRAFLRQGHTIVGRAYLLEAHRLYGEWRAEALVARLVAEVPALAGGLAMSPTWGGATIPLPEATHTNTYTTESDTTRSERGDALDLIALLRANQALSEEIRLDRLMDTTVGVLTANAGATRGYLAVEQDGALVVVAGQDADGRALLEAEQPLSDCDGVARSVVSFVAHGGSAVVLGDAREDARFASDARVQAATGPLSVLCSPVVHQRKLVGVFYLENDLTARAFTPGRTRMADVLSTQAAISLENARLYSDLEDRVVARTPELADALEALETKHGVLKRAQAQLVQSEKMASLGQLVAGIAHEINNPINFIATGLPSLERDLGRLKEMVREADRSPNYEKVVARISKLMGVVAEGARRTTEIVANLSTFSRLNEAELKTASLAEALDSTLALLRSRLQDVQVVRDYAELQPIECYVSQLNQVFMNLFVNALQAMEGRGTLTIRLRPEADGVRITVEDTGPGIPPAVLPRIFDPFFTTKDVGEGTGLGLSISHGIVENHGGRIDVESPPGAGASFHVHLPETPPERDGSSGGGSLIG